MATDKLDWLKPDAAKAKNAGSNRHVFVARIVLPVLVVIILAISIIWSQSGPSLKVKEATLADVQNTLEEARFTSVDKNGDPFVIEAERVIQQDPATMAAQLALPRGALKTKEGQTVSVTAKDGLYKHNEQELQLNGDVVMTRDDGLTMTTDALDVDLEGKNAKGDKPVTATTANGDVLKAQHGIEVTGGGEKILFKGPASLTLQPKSQKMEP